LNASVRQGFAAPAKLFLGLAQAQEKIMQLQDMFSQISARHKSAEQVSSAYYVELNIRLVMAKKRLCIPRPKL